MKVRCPKFIKKLFSPFIKLYNLALDKISKSIRLELIVIFAVCLVASIIVGSISNDTFKKGSMTARIDYTKGVKRISDKALNIADTIKNRNVSINDKENINQILQQSKNGENYKILISDLDGKVLYKSDNANETQIDIYATIKNTMETMGNREISVRNNDEIIDTGREYVNFYPIKFSDGKGYLMVSGIPKGDIVYHYGDNTPLPTVIVSLAVFFFTFYFLTKKKMKYIELVSSGLFEISKGNLDYRIEKLGSDEIALLADNINFMAEELKNKIEDERKAERMKSELITNVSHDLRTPLTSIKGYLGLIKEKKYNEKEQLEQYVNIAYNKSEKLEVLINDLFEYTKLTNNGVKLDKQAIVLDGLLDQLVEELVPIFEENKVVVSKAFLLEKVIVEVDPGKTARIFENLFINAARYSIKPGIIKVVLTKDNDYVIVSIQNKCEEMNKEELEKIFDRFYRLEKSRASETGGSGLGLAIARSIVELQGGTIEAKYSDKNISFDVKLKIYKG
ncbi:HAMP domain-containing sensor histidine kinase [Clostridium sp. OS1-26]|uniref:sensor histidine kinase n=1 Tax=Clostridium sp. OS1-26 TaxID=3070681 RepID=UPI0027E0E1DD|nr:HAMP domain-containing sensor histidine kinase [Clostridium sp. OS1-26]WML35198.1 HAMP domain-containing sensor histidine kinase [Clostridium sp. OS1-26]